MQNGGDGPNACHVRVKWVKRTRFLSPRVTACDTIGVVPFFFFENELAWYLADVNFTTTSLHHSPRITRARTRDGSTKTNPPFITATFVTCEIIIMTVCDYMNLSWMRLRNKNEPSFHRHVYFELNGCVDGLAKRGQERSRAWNNMIN